MLYPPGFALLLQNMLEKDFAFSKFKKSPHFGSSEKIGWT